LFGLGPLVADDGWVELMLPSLSALFASSSATSLLLYGLGDFDPLKLVLGTSRHHLKDDIVFLSSPPPFGSIVCHYVAL
jgi:hypothetical protein